MQFLLPVTLPFQKKIVVILAHGKVTLYRVAAQYQFPADPQVAKPLTAHSVYLMVHHQLIKI